MAASPMIDKQEHNLSTQTRSNVSEQSSLSTPTPRPSPPTRRFQEITKQIISTSTRRSITGTHRNAPTLLSSEARSSNSGKARRYSFSNVVACATANHRSSDYATQLSNSGKDSLSARASADDGNRRYSHQGASSCSTSNGGSHSISSNSKVKYGSSRPSPSRFSHPNASSSIEAFSHPTSSSDILDHGSSYPTSSTDIDNHGSSNPTSSRKLKDDIDFENPRSGLSNGAHAGDKQMHSAHAIRPHIGSTSHFRLQGRLASRNLANTSSQLSESRAAAPKGIARVVETYDKSHAGIRDSATKHRRNELCKDCKASIMESVCFIANDGRISAAITGAAYARHSHHCNVRGCAANRSYDKASSKKDSLSKRQAPLNPQPTRRKPHILSGVGDRGSTASSVQGDDFSKQETAELSLRGGVELSSSTGSDTHDMKQELNFTETSHKSFAIKCSEGDESHVNTDSLCQAPIDQNGLDAFSPCKDGSQSPSMPVPKDQQSYGENSHVENVEVQSTPDASCISSDIHDDDDDDDDDDGEKGSVYRDDIQALNDFKSLLYHGDNEYSCSEDGTEASTTPNSFIKGAFDDLLNTDIEQSGHENELPRTRRSTMARMRQRYLESLKEHEAETVRLRKQEIMARKQAGDWMLDCHMEEVLHRLAPNGEARVKVLVEAFETVINHSDSESSQTAHHQDEEHLENLHSYSSF